MVLQCEELDLFRNRPRPIFKSDEIKLLFKKPRGDEEHGAV